MIESFAKIRRLMRIGQIAERTGLSAKALRLYEARGLLTPDGHSERGYRLFGEAALTRLMRIRLLKRAGFSLAEIGALLDHEAPVETLVDARIDALQGELNQKTQALRALEEARRRLDSASTLDIDQLLESIQMSDRLDMNFSESDLAEFKRRAEILGQHFSETEREQMRQRAEQLGETGLRQAQQAWPQLIAQVRAAMDAGTPATDPTVIEMGRRWHGLVNAFTGGDANIARRLKEAYINEPEVMAAQRMDPSMFAYIRTAMAAAGLSL